MKKTLIIHPRDRSTDFLKPIYEDIPYKTVIRGGLSQLEVKHEILNHQNIIMMGHGCPNGLFSVGMFQSSGLIIDKTTVEFLRNKKAVYIWCNADEFVKEHKLEGFFSGMFVSEVSEAVAMNLTEIDQAMVDESNQTFSDIMRNTITKPFPAMLKTVKSKYGELAKTNPVAYYNVNRLYTSQLMTEGYNLVIN